MEKNTKEPTIKNPLTSNADKDKMPISKSRYFDELENYIASKYGMFVDGRVKSLNFEAVKQAFGGVERMIVDYPMSHEIKKLTEEVLKSYSGGNK